MALFNRNRNQQPTVSVLPSEVDAYYRAEQRKRRGSAFILGFMTLVLTVLIVLSIFFLGRYFYSKLRTSEDKKIPVASTNDAQTEQKKSADDTTTKTTDTQQAAPSVAAPAPQAQPNSVPQSSTAPSTMTPATGDTFPGTTLPRTGDEGM
jgi:cytoskeletal protein RodZ